MPSYCYGCRDGGHTYPLNRAAVVITSNGAGESSIIPSQLTGGNAPPQKARRMDGPAVIELVRPATDAEIDALSDEVLVVIERNIKAVMVPVEG